MKFLLATKQNMIQVYDEAGRAFAGTVLSATPLTVTAVKTNTRDGYEAVQVGFGVKKSKNVSKSVLGSLKGITSPEAKTTFAHLKEFRVEGTDLTPGAVIDLSALQEGEAVTVSGVSKGKGFQGVVKRHGFHGGRRSHGQKHSEREPGSIGGGGRAGGRVAKGMRMAGRMGSDRVSVKGLRILKIDSANNLIVVSGAVPGRRGTLLEVTTA
jgi:large subunit ribosomal protein L3